MKEIPILYSTDMIQANLDDIKTMTRRVINPQPIIDEHSGFVFDGKYKKQYSIHDWKNRFIDDFSRWMPGDLLWARESSIPDFPKDLTYYDNTWEEVPEEYRKPEHVIYKASWSGSELLFKPSIHMPKWAARIWKEVLEVRIERLQDISRQDAIDEGIGRWTEERMRSKPTHYQLYYTDTGDESMYSSCPILSYESLWKKINGPESWDANPWVWVIKFKILSKTGKPKNL